MDYSANDPTQQRLLVAALMGKMAAADDNDEEDVAPVPTAPGTPYTPLVTRDTAPASSAPPPNLLAQALANSGGVTMPAAGLPAPSATHYAQGPGGPLLLNDNQDALTAGKAQTPPTPAAAAQGAQAPPATAAQAAAGSADAYTQWTIQHHAEALAGYNQARAQAQAAINAGKPDIAEVYLKAAEGYRTEVEKASELYGATLKSPQSVKAGEWVYSPQQGKYVQPVPPENKTNAPTEEEAAYLRSAGLDPSKYQSKDGELIPITTTVGEKKQLHVIGRDAFGNDQYGVFDPGTGEVTPYKPAASASEQAAVPAQIQELGLPNADAGQGDKTPSVALPPDQQARLAQVSPQIRSTVESILQGRLGLPKITAGRGNVLPLAITQSVLAVNPQFDANTNQNQLLARKAFNAGGSNNTPGQLILNSDAAIDHFVPLVEASDALPNYGSLLGPAILGTERGVPGNLAGEDFKKKVASLQSAATPASAETMKYLAGTTGGGEEERQQLIKSFSDIGGSQASRRESVANYLDDMLAKKAELQNQWRNAMGPAAPDFPVISDTARNSVIKMGYGALLAKYGLDKASPAAPAAPGPVRIKGESDYNALPSGTVYTAPDGSQRTKK